MNYVKRINYNIIHIMIIITIKIKSDYDLLV